LKTTKKYLNDVSKHIPASFQDNFPDISEEESFILKSSRRRGSLKALLEEENYEQTLKDTARKVASWEYNTCEESLSDKEYRRIYISLLQTHLPAFEKHDILEFDKDKSLIYGDESLDRFEPYLDGRPHEDELMNIDGFTPKEIVYEPLSKNDAFMLLSNSRRRKVMRFLEDSDKQYHSLSEISEVLAAEENDKPKENVRSGERKSVYIPLYQEHLPKLDKHNVIEYNSDRNIFKEDIYLDPLTNYLPGNTTSTDEGVSLNSLIPKRFQKI